jgi:hypothetical protein
MSIHGLVLDGWDDLSAGHPRQAMCADRGTVSPRNASSWPGSWPETAVGEADAGAGDEAVGE